MTGESTPGSLTEFIERVENSQWTGRIVNQSEPEPVERMIENLFGGLSIDTAQEDLPSADDDHFVLLDDDDVVASSSLQTLKQTLLLVNSDLYRTGTRTIESIEVPDVILSLSDTVFTLRGYPAGETEKLVLTLVARYIEHRAWVEGSGVIRSSFQRLSRLDDEQGTREVYERLGGETALDVHVYGLPDWEPPETMGVTTHGVTDEEIVRHWFVVYEGPDEEIAMLAAKTGTNEWKGYWTFDADEVRSLARYIERTF